MRGLGVTAWPFEHGLEIGRVLNLLRCLVMERGIVDNADGLTRHLIAQCEEMGEIVLTESGIVFLEPANTLLLLRLAFTCEL